MADTQLEEHTHLSYALSQLIEHGDQIEHQNNLMKIEPQEDVIKINQQFDSIDAIRQAAIRYARQNRFAVSTLRSGARQLVLVCKHSGKYRETKSKTVEKPLSSPPPPAPAPAPATTTTTERMSANSVQNGEIATIIENGIEVQPQQQQQQSGQVQKKQTRKKLSQKIQCPFQIRAKPLGGRWIIYKIVDDHNHEMATDIRAYAQHRKLTEETKKMIIDLMHLGTSNAKIMEHLLLQGIENVLKKDIANLRQAHFSNKSTAVKRETKLE